MFVRMNGEFIQNKISKAPYFGSLEEAAKTIPCDSRTLASAIAGGKVRLSTAKLFCEFFKLEQGKTIIIEPTMKALAVDDNNEISEAVELAYKVAQGALKQTIKHYGALTTKEVSDVLSLFLVEYGVELTANGPMEGLFFIDAVSNRAKTALGNHIRDETNKTSGSD